MSSGANDIFGAARQVAANDSDEEEKHNPELDRARRSSGAGGDPLSASQKIAEMGLSRGASEVVAPTESEK